MLDARAVFVLVGLLLVSWAAPALARPPREPAKAAEKTAIGAGDVQRVAPEIVRQQVTAGKALLVCAYDSAEKFAKVRLADAISFAEFKQRKPTLSKEQSIVFYCA